MTVIQVTFLLLAGISAALGQFSITAAYSYAPARDISAYDYTQVIFSAIMSFLVFGTIPDMLSITGYLVICATAVVMFLYNKKVK